MAKHLSLQIAQTEQRLEQQRDPLQRILLIDILAGHYAFTNPQHALSLLKEQHELLLAHSFPDFRLNYHLHYAAVENHLYHYAQSEEHFLLAIAMMEERGTAQQQAEVYIDYAGTCMNLEKMSVAADCLEKAARLLKKFPDERLLARLICREGFMNLRYNNYPKAIALFLEAEKLTTSLGASALSIKDYYFLTLVHSGLGKVYEKNDDFDKSVRAYLKVVKMCEALQMRTRLSWHYLNVGVGYMAINEALHAEKFFIKAIETDDDESQHARASAYGNLGYGYFEKGRYKEALEHFDRAEQVYKAFSEEDHYNLSIIESWRGALFLELRQYEEAIEHLTLALDYASGIADYKQLSTVCQSIAQFYAEQGDFKNAYEYQVIHDSYNGMYAEQLNHRKQMELEAKYEAAQKKQETELLKLQATKLQLKALRAQMNPHFMYNALNSIQSFMTSNDVHAASKYLAKFAKLMRQSLDYSDLEIISLEKEVEFLEDFLYINQKLRFEDRLQYHIHVDDEIEDDILGVPTMIVQPYVENAIEHGVRSRKDGMVKVSFHLFDEDTILCTVEDNGVGREQARMLRLQDPQYLNHRSKGTRITEERLEILHQNKNLGDFVKIVDLQDAEGKATGTRVEILIPVVEVQMK